MTHTPVVIMLTKRIHISTTYWSVVNKDEHHVVHCVLTETCEDTCQILFFFFFKLSSSQVQPSPSYVLLTGSAMKSIVGRKTEPAITSRSSRARDLREAAGSGQDLQRELFYVSLQRSPAVCSFGWHQVRKQRLR